MSGFHHGQRWQQRAMILFYFILFYLFFLILFFQASTMGQRWQQRAKRRHSKPLRHIFSKVSFLEALHKKYTEGSTDMILLPGGIIRRAWDWVFVFFQACSAFRYDSSAGGEHTTRLGLSWAFPPLSRVGAAGLVISNEVTNSLTYKISNGLFLLFLVLVLQV